MCVYVSMHPLYKVSRVTMSRELSVWDCCIKLKMHFELPLRMGASCQFCVKINEAKWQFNQGVSYVRAPEQQQQPTQQQEQQQQWGRVSRVISGEQCEFAHRAYFSVCLSLSACAARCKLRVAQVDRVGHVERGGGNGVLAVRKCITAFVSRKSRTGCKCFWHLTGDALTAIKMHTASGNAAKLSALWTVNYELELELEPVFSICRTQWEEVEVNPKIEEK